MNSDSIKIVAIGASAGGLEPLEHFFAAVKGNPGCSFIVVQHLSPDFRSMMDELLGRHTKLPIERISDGLELKPNTIYLNLPRVTVTVENSRFRLRASSNPVDLYHPIDMLFGSVAEQFGANVLGIILSGTGSDGTQGAEQIKQFGGQVIVQLPETARFESMPRSVIDARLEDGSGDANHLATLAASWINGERLMLAPLRPVEGDPVGSIIALIRRHTSLDFERYKPATVQRRIERRASLKGLADLTEYYNLIVENPDELDLLYSDMLIEVTSFFRDLKAFESLDKLSIEPLIQKLRDGGSLRIWVAGCASGEEVYSIAMLLVERAEAEGLTLDARILATDAHGRSLANANAGRFPRESITHLSSERVQRFFDIHGDYVQFKSDIRKLLLFSTHDVIRDTPFTQIDLLSCRNLLIYLNNEAQEHVIAKFHFALLKGGTLFLGPSESPVGIIKEFEVLDSRWRIYRKRRNVPIKGNVDTVPTVAPLQSIMSRTEPEADRPDPPTKPYPLLPDQRTLKNKQAHHYALEQMISVYAPPGFLLTETGDVVHVFGDAGELLPVSSGAFTQKLTDLIKDEFKATVFSALFSARQPDFERFERRLYVNSESGGQEIPYDITLTRVTWHAQENAGDTFLLLTVREVDHDPLEMTRVRNPEITNTPDPSDSADTALLLQRIRNLEDGLKASEESLQMTIEELETSNEELQSTNEELTASNEELQSTNEELQSTNEELHSVNEELFTVSAEHQRRTNELAELNDEVDKLLEQSDIGTLHLDSELRVKRYSKAARNLFQLSAANLSRTVDAVVCNDDDIALATLAREVVATGRPWESEVSINGKYFVLKVVANRDSQNDIIGVLITSIDTTSLKTVETELARIGADYREIVEDTASHIMRWEADTTRILFCNDRFASYFDVKAEDLVGQLLRPLIPSNQRDAFFDFVKTITPGEGRFHHITRPNADGTTTVTGGITRAITDPKDKVVAYQSIGQNLSAAYGHGAALERLVSIVGDLKMPSEERLKRLLELGIEELGMETAHLAERKGNGYRTWASAGKNAEAVSDERFLPVHATLYRSLPTEPHVLYFSRQENALPEQKEALAKTGIQSFIGRRIHLQNGTEGSICFHSATPQGDHRVSQHESLVSLIATWAARLTTESKHRASVPS